MGVMDDSVGRESTDHKWDPYQKQCIKLVTKLSGCCIDENRWKTLKGLESEMPAPVRSAFILQKPEEE